MARTNGFLVTAKFFLPYDAADLDDIAAKANAVKAAKSGDLSKLVGAIPVSVEHKATSREVPDAPTPPAAANGENAADDDAAHAEAATGRRKAG